MTPDGTSSLCPDADCPAVAMGVEVRTLAVLVQPNPLPPRPQSAPRPTAMGADLTAPVEDGGDGQVVMPHNAVTIAPICALGGGIALMCALTK
jgi:hypothetical protein